MLLVVGVLLCKVSSLAFSLRVFHSIPSFVTNKSHRNLSCQYPKHRRRPAALVSPLRQPCKAAVEDGAEKWGALPAVVGNFASISLDLQLMNSKFDNNLQQNKYRIGHYSMLFVVGDPLQRLFVAL